MSVEPTLTAEVTRALQEFIARCDPRRVVELFGSLEWDAALDDEAEQSTGPPVQYQTAAAPLPLVQAPSAPDPQRRRPALGTSQPNGQERLPALREGGAHERLPRPVAGRLGSQQGGQRQVVGAERKDERIRRKETAHIARRDDLALEQLPHRAL